MSLRPAHRRATRTDDQHAWIVFGGDADQFWLRPLRHGFRHCFAALRDDTGWTVLDPLSGRVVVARLALPATFDLPEFYLRAGLKVLGPYVPEAPRACWLPSLLPLNCVTLCRAVLGPQAPFAWTPFGFFQALQKNSGNRKNVLTQPSLLD